MKGLEKNLVSVSISRSKFLVSVSKNQFTELSVSEYVVSSNRGVSKIMASYGIGPFSSDASISLYINLPGMEASGPFR